MTHEEIKNNILSKMVDGEKYRPSDLGYFAFGSVKNVVSGAKFHYTPQGLAFAVGKHLNRMHGDGLIKRVVSNKNNFCWKLNSAKNT